VSKSRLGQEGEARAAALLESRGIKIIARNFRSQWGEIDLIAAEGETLAFIEVKTWNYYGYGELEYGINSKKRRRIIETAKYFLSVHREYNGMALRFDVIFIAPDKISHLPGAFMEQI
jgi:putative endonuclease